MQEEIGSQHDHVGFVRTHPFRQRTRGYQPSANECAAWVLRAIAVDGTLMVDTERARLSPRNPMSTHFDLQPAIAACRAASAASLIVAFHRGGQPSVRLFGLRSDIAHFKFAERQMLGFARRAGRRKLCLSICPKPGP